MRDILIAKEALARSEIPLIGSFSSAGPFVFGPLFYWFIMLSFLVIPFTILAPWIFLTIVGVSSVFVLMYIGKLIGGPKLAIVLGILSATSPQLVTRSIALNQHSLVGITAALLLLFFVILWQSRQQYLEGAYVITSSQLDYIVDLQNDKAFQQKKGAWTPVNRENIYDDLMKWQKTDKLTSTFSLTKFIGEKLHIL